MPVLTLALLASCSSRLPQATSYGLCRAYAEARGWTHITSTTTPIGRPRSVTVQGRAPVPQASDLVQCQIEGGEVASARVVAGDPL